MPEFKNAVFNVKTIMKINLSKCVRSVQTCEKGGHKARVDRRKGKGSLGSLNWVKAQDKNKQTNKQTKTKTKTKAKQNKTKQNLFNRQMISANI